METVILTGKVFYEELDGSADVELEESVELDDNTEGFNLSHVLNSSKYCDKRVRVTIEILED
jgi:hypothetical protein